jgi:sulfite exporter TauE/SafE
MSCEASSGFLAAGFGSLFGLGFFGSMHCLGMCGPLSCLAASRGGEAPGLPALGLYHAGRAAAYALLGGALWGLAAPLRLSLPWPVLAWLAALPLLAYAYGVSWEAPAGLARRLAAWHAKALGFFGRFSATARALGLGLLTPLLPCGLLYAATSLSLSAPSRATAAAWMAAFALGTLPALALGQAGFARMSPRMGPLFLRRASAAAAAAAIMLFAFFGRP